MARKNKLLRRRLITTETGQIAADAAPVEDEPEPETGPLRRCVLTRQRLPKERMIRFVVGPDRQIVPDLTAKLPGRGILVERFSGCVRIRARARGQTTTRRTNKRRPTRGRAAEQARRRQPSSAHTRIRQGR